MASPCLRRSPSPPPHWARSPSLTAPLSTEGAAESEESSGDADGEAEAEAYAWGLADVRELHPGLLAHRAARTCDLPALAAALAHGAEVNWADAEDEGKTPLVQAVLGVSGRGGCAEQEASSVACIQGPSSLCWRQGSVPATGAQGCCQECWGPARAASSAQWELPGSPGLFDRL